MRRAGLASIVVFLALAGAQSAADADRYDVYAVRFATLADSPVSRLVAGADSTRRADLAMTFWVLKGLDGRIALVDSGFHRDAHLRESGVKDYIRPSEAILPLGIQPADVTDILLTDLHWDHAGGVDLFPKAHVWVQKEQYEYYTGQAWQLASAHAGVDPEDVLHLVRLNTSRRLTLLGGNNDFLMSGVMFNVVGEQGSSSQFIAAQGRQSLVVLAADHMPMYDSMKVRATAPAGAAARVSLVDRIVQLASEPRLAVPGHDPAVFTRFRKISDRIVQIE